MSRHHRRFRPHGRRPGPTRSRLYRVGVPPRLDARVLSCGLEDDEETELIFADPPELRRRLCDGQLEAALLPSVELQQADESLLVLPAGCICASGRSLAARLFAHNTPEELEHISGSAMAPTSATVACVLWASQYRRRLVAPAWDSGADRAPAHGQGVVVEGDAVLTHPPLGFDRQFDLTGMWHEATGLPLVMAVWATRAQTPLDCERLLRVLSAACQRGRRHLADIVRLFTAKHGWPGDLAHRYLLSEVHFEFTDACRDGLEELFFLAAGYDVIERYRPLAYYEP